MASTSSGAGARGLTPVDVDSNALDSGPPDHPSNQREMASERSSTDEDNSDADEDNVRLFQMDCKSSDSDGESSCEELQGREDDDTEANSMSKLSQQIVKNIFFDIEEQEEYLDKIKDYKEEKARKAGHRRLLYLAKRLRFTEAALLSMFNPLTEQDVDLAQDSKRRTAAHYAAMHPEGESILEMILLRRGKKCLLEKDYRDLTPLHFSVACQSKRVLQIILADWGDSRKKVSRLLNCNSRWSKNGIMHYAAMNRMHPDMLRILRDFKHNTCQLVPYSLRFLFCHFQGALYRALPFQCNLAGQTMLHVALQNCSVSTAIELIDWAVSNSFKAQLKSPDSSGNSCIHYAAMRKGFDKVLHFAVTRTGGVCLGWTNNRMQSVLHLAVKNCNASTMKFLLRQANKKQLKICDVSKNSWLHYAAMNTSSDLALKAAFKEASKNKIVQKGFSSSLFALTESDPTTPQLINLKNGKSQTVLHLAAQNCKLSSFEIEILVLTADPQCLQLQDNSGNTCLHHLAMRSDCDDALTTAVDIAGPECLQVRNKLNQSVLHLAVKKCNSEVVAMFIKRGSTRNMTARDGNGDTMLHLAVTHKKYSLLEAAVEKLGTECLMWQNNRQQTVMHLAFCDPNCRCLLLEALSSDAHTFVSMLDSTGRNLVFYACAAWNIEALEAASRMKDEMLRVDIDGNTLMHALFMNRESCSNTEPFIRALNILADVGVDPATENSIGQTCLHVSHIHQDSLLRILHQAAEDKHIGKLFKAMLVNSNGLHAVHRMCGRYNLQEISGPLAKLSGMEVKRLVQLTVSSGSLKGATCLHFACEAGHKSNVSFLMETGLSLSALTHSGKSCVDFACSKGMEEVVRKVTYKLPDGTTRSQFLRLLDPARRAVNLPDRDTAHRTLVSVFEDRGASEALSTLGSSEDETGEDECTRRDVRVLLRAIELDSPMILRCALSLNIISNETESLAVSSVHTDLAQKSEMTIVDVAISKNKFLILPDLILLRQFELIPTCLKTLIELKQKMKQMPERRQQLKELRRNVSCIAANALDEMFCNGTEKEKQLLFDYLCGRMLPENSGPRFACQRTEAILFGVRPSDLLENHPCTLVQLMLNTKCSELLATECMSELANREWKNKRSSLDIIEHADLSFKVFTSVANMSSLNMIPASPRMKFYINWIWDIIILLLYPLLSIILPINGGSGGTTVAYSFWKWSYIVFTFHYFAKGSSRFLKYLIGQNTSSANAAFGWLDVVSSVVQSVGIVGVVGLGFEYRMVLATSFLFFGFRFVSLLTYWRATGPMVIMIERLLRRDLLPFLAIISVIVYSFGIFFFHLLYPVPDQPGHWWYSFVQVYTLPLKLLFTDFDRIKYEAVSTTNLSGFQTGTVAYEGGSAVFNDVAEFAYLLLVNLVMMNLLIALFSLRVSRVSSKSDVIWRRMYFEMLVECSNMLVVPPPLYIPFILVYPVIFCFNFIRRLIKCDFKFLDQTKPKNWWHSEADYPMEYQQYLLFQARQLRRCRSSLMRQTEADRDDFGGLRAHLNNSFAAVRRDLDDIAGTLRQAEISRQEDRDVLRKVLLRERLASQGHSSSRRHRRAKEKASV